MTDFPHALNPTQLRAFDAIETNKKNILVLGSAGTGKSTFINYLKSASAKKIICACPTGVSALNIGGQTIHSLFQIQPRDFILPELLKLKSKPRNIIVGADVLVIDEISMVAPDLLDAIDILCRRARRNNEPFGGIQVVAIGDLFQLPPVINREAEPYYTTEYGQPNSYFFDSHVYKRAKFEKINFDVVYRQSDGQLLEKLTALRNNEAESALPFFNELKIDDIARRENAVLITPFRAVADSINRMRLAQINAPEILYRGELTGNFAEKDVPSPLELLLKKGALVMFTRNIRESGRDCMNGTMGIITELGAREIKLRLLSTNDVVSVKPEKWEKIEYSRDENEKIVEKETGTFKQFPLALAYAMTIHKAQGKTLDAVIIDMSRGAFAHGQTYVALSRTRSAKDMHIERPLRTFDVIFDERVLDFIN